ncbi:MAG TPA: phosphoribosyltransferase family protein [bacterium]|nr:phosphoribosyltransferase family protein [bacterium]
MDKKHYSKQRLYTWKELENDVSKLAKEILQKYVPEVVLAVAEGGWIPARLLENCIDAEYFSIGCSYYDKHDSKLDAPLVYQLPSTDNLDDKKVLIIDEVCESGSTLRHISDLLHDYHPKEIRTAVLHKKVSSGFRPDFFIHSVEQEWIIYPWTSKY